MIHPVHCRVNVMVSDMGASVAFYTEKLGLELVNRYGDHYAEVRGPDMMLGLHPVSKKTTYGNNLSIGLGVAEFDTAVEQLRSFGIDISVEADGWIRLAHFSDPDGNLLFLAENQGT